ncbi:hypothetical protein RUM43_003126 [Polyplax serrata]|uniref:BED-type domain-containing protein n=1 Tax=Polyplax serrata TaxID=468196 RepID=A0AAN8NUS7_POLSC
MECTANPPTLVIRTNEWFTDETMKKYRKGCSEKRFSSSISKSLPMKWSGANGSQNKNVDLPATAYFYWKPKKIVMFDFEWQTEGFSRGSHIFSRFSYSIPGDARFGGSLNHYQSMYTNYKTSPIWTYFERRDGRSKCLICCTTLSGVYTTNAEKHLRTKHPKPHADFQLMKMNWINSRKLYE